MCDFLSVLILKNGDVLHHPMLDSHADLVAYFDLPDDSQTLIVDGCWIVGGKAIVRDVCGGRILRVQDSAQVHGVGGSAQVHGVGGSAQVYGPVGPDVRLDASAKAHLLEATAHA